MYYMFSTVIIILHISSNVKGKTKKDFQKFGNLSNCLGSIYNWFNILIIVPSYDVKDFCQ